MTEVTSIVVALLCMLGQVSGLDCDVDATPHPEGICGDELIRTRDNLCFLLREDYPDIFGKRSVNDIFNYPVDSFAALDFHGYETEEETTHHSKHPRDNGLDRTRLAKVRPFLPVPASSTLRDPAKGGDNLDGLTHVQKRGIVCDCCFNRCKPSILARYC